MIPIRCILSVDACFIFEMFIMINFYRVEQNKFLIQRQSFFSHYNRFLKIEIHCVAPKIGQ